jgi:hypothetical protein
MQADRARRSLVQHPLSDPAFDPVQPDFQTRWPDGYPVPSPPTPTRISPYTSTSRVHSLTYTGLSSLHPQPLNYVKSLSPTAFPARLVLSVLHISLPYPAPGSEYNKPPNIARLMALLDPKTFIVTERPPSIVEGLVSDPSALRPHNTLKLWSSRSDAMWPPQRPWIHLSLVIVGYAVSLRGFGQCIQPSSDRPTKSEVLYLLDLSKSSNPAEGFEAERADVYEDALDYEAEERLVFRVWVGTEQARKEVWKEQEEWQQYGEYRFREPAKDVVVPSERMARWMEDLRSAATGRKTLNREVLEELRR